jgi:Transcription factor WhiB.
VFDSALKGAVCATLSEPEKRLFFGANNQYMRAKAYCNGKGKRPPCPAREACLQKALEFEVPGVKRHGVWGGMTAPERNRVFGDTMADIEEGAA